MVTWARAVRKPSDLGFSDAGFDLPPLIVNQHQVCAAKPLDGFLFDLPAVGLDEQRQDLKRTLHERCEMAATIANHNDPVISWCNLNAEGDLLEKLIEGAVQVSGSDSEERKESVFSDFINGNIRVLVTKPSIGGFGLNLQHCANQTYFPSHSYEQYYQCVRRCWRFGQKRKVTVDMITTDGQSNVVKNLEAKSDAAIHMFRQLVSMMANELKIETRKQATKKVTVASWL
jgi:hypothetical protein